MAFDAKKHKDKCVTWIKKFFEKMDQIAMQS